MNASPLIHEAAPPSTQLARAMRNHVLGVESADGSLDLYLPSPGVLLGVARGHLTLRMAQRWIGEMGPRLDHGEVIAGFHDWQLMTSYASEARYALTSFVRGTGTRQPGHFLVASKLVAMGVSAASLTLAIAGVKLASYASRPKFEDALMTAIAQ